MKHEQILIVDDSPDTLEIVKRNLKTKGFSVYTSESVEQAIGILEVQPVDLVITDMKMPKTSGIDLIQHIRDNYQDTEVMMITGYATVENAVSAMKAGAEEFLPKPFTKEELYSAVERALEKLSLKKAGQSRTAAMEATFPGIIGESSAIQNILAAVQQISSTNATVLITGESGTGKELIARAIHYTSKRASAPFIPVNCGAIPESLLESELFGYKKGAFTGAEHSRAGFFQTADGGTIFLDEISETIPSMQIKLLRVLQEKEVYMVGSTKSFAVDVRIVTATNKDLHTLVEKGKFREDLFYRLNVLTIELPPLRERENDVILLAKHFISKYSEEIGRKPPKLSDKTLEAMKNYSWPGNVRELENIIQRIVIMSQGDSINVPDLPDFMHFSAKRKSSQLKTLEEAEREHIEYVLSVVNNNKTKAAQILGIDRKTLRNKLDNNNSKNN